ncbi:insulinase family protein [Marinobacter caseinilyticus]|uniref:insulinase family protein n=1 Tax=Marinobacter caseinilyticus TaxID=2692195 RepID=UPI00140D768B|nr:insulinase family protein [Marinobacter caseinilyticus]
MRITPSRRSGSSRGLSGFLITGLFLLVTVAANAAVSPVKSPNDGNDYRYLALANGIKVLLVSDPDADKAAAALDITVGSGDDPADREGLAHFLEHMLFLGTEKYPEAGEYQQFIKNHGGSHNAFTAFQDTNYFFEIQAEHLEPALDRFAQQFAAPLFTGDLVERERRAVHSEYTSALKDDGRRAYSVKKAIANPQNAFSQFAVGNLTTLEDTPERPLRVDLVTFWRNHYSANLMTLVVYGPQSLDTLETMVRPRFTAIANRELAAKTHTAPLLDNSKLPALVEIEALKDIRRLSLTFPIPSQQVLYRSKPDHYVSNLLGHEGPGSLLDTLKTEGLVESLSAGNGIDTGEYSTLDINMTLTPQGLARRDDIIRLTFAYIEKIREQGISRQQFDEMQRLADIGFRFQERSSPIHQVSRLAMQLQHVAPVDVLQAPWIMASYQPEQYRDILNRLTPENVIVSVLSPQSPGANSQRTTWYDAAYSFNRINLDALIGAGVPKLADRLDLPEPNPFIPEDLAMVSGATMAQPERLLPGSDSALELWFAKDVQFDTPKANVYLSLRSPAVRASARSHVLTQLLVDAINTNLNAWAYPAQLAGLNYNVYTHLRGVTIRVGGYSDKLHTLLTRILSQFAAPTISEQRFNIARRQLVDNLKNQFRERPVEQASGVIQNALIEGSWTAEEKLAAANDVSLDELRRFADLLTRQTDPVMLAHGNLTPASALNLARMVQALVLDASQPIAVPRSGVRSLPGGETEAIIEVDHPDTGYALYVQGDSTSFDERARFRLLAQILSAPFYEQIRTQQQLGYVVYAAPYEILETPAIGFIVQSPEASAQQIDAATRAFADSFEKTLNSMTSKEFEVQKRAVISSLLDQDRTLGDVSERYWREIDRSATQFDSREKMVDAINRIDKPQLTALYQAVVVQRTKALKVVTAKTGGNSTAVIERLRKRPAVQ